MISMTAKLSYLVLAGNLILVIDAMVDLAKDSAIFEIHTPLIHSIELSIVLVVFRFRGKFTPRKTWIRLEDPSRS